MTPADLAALNPPGARTLRFRVGTYAKFLERMYAELPLRTVRDDGPLATRPLEVLDPSTSGDFAAALLDAWAAVGDVLTFYQERLLNEGYLRTAREPRSVRELVAELGFPLEPGVASTTTLAFSVSGAPGSPEKITVPAGTAAQSIPGTGEQPQTFETSHPLLARPAWNAMVPAPAFTTVAQALAVTGTQARLTGAGTGLSVGAPLLAASADGSAWSFGVVTTVEPSAQARETRVVWAPVPAGTQGTGALAGPAVWAFGRTTRLFGYNAAPWSSLGTEQRRAFREILGGVYVFADGAGDWAGASGGLPAVNVVALAVDEAGRVYAGTAGRGLYVSVDGGAAWSAGGPRYGEVYSLAAGSPGRVYAGMSGGRVYRSCDGGQSWDSVSGATVLAAPRKGAPPELVATRLPAGPVRAVFDDGQGTLYAGTDFGPYTTPEAVPAWTALPLAADGPTPAHGAASSPPAPASPAVWSFALAPWGDVAIGTDAGVWSADTRLPLGTGLLATAADGQPNVVRALLAHDRVLLAGTDAGLFELTAPSGGWTPFPGPCDGSTPLAITALALTWDHEVVAGTPAGVYVRKHVKVHGHDRTVWCPLGTQGMPRPPASASPPCDSPPCDSPPCGSPPGDCGQHAPIPAPPGLNQTNVTALAAGPGVLVAAAPYAGFPVEGWPAPPICGSVVTLSGVVPQVVPGSWIVLQQAPDPAGGGPAPAVRVLRVLAARTGPVTAYGRSGQATEVRVEPACGLEVFDLRATTVYAASRSLPLVSARLPDLVPFAGTRLKLAGALPPLPAGGQVSVTGQRIRAAAWPAAGVFVPAKAPKAAALAPAGLASVDVVAVAWAPGGVILAAVGGEPGAAGPAAGLYASADGGATWTPAGGALEGRRVHALASGPAAAWAAGPHGALFTSADGVAWRAVCTAGHAVVALAVDAAGTPWAATADAGVWSVADGKWQPIGAGLPAGSVRALAPAPGGGMAAATAAGVWWLAPGARAWTAWNAKLGNLDVRAVAVLSTGGALAGTAGGGVFSSPAPGGDWSPASGGLGAPGAAVVTALAAGAGGRAWVGTRGAGCFSLAAGATAWVPEPLGAANDVRALAAGPGGVLAGCGGVPLLVSAGGARASLALEPLLALPADYAADLDRGSLSAALLKTLGDAGIKLPTPPVVRTQTAGSAWWIDAPQGVLLLRLDAGAVRVRRPRGLATLLGPPPSTPAGVAVADGVGNGGTLTPRAGELLWQPGSPAAQPVSEVAMVASGASAGLRSTTVTLQAPLANAYDPSTVQLCGNLAAATQGATQGLWPYLEVLGNGDATAAGQTFGLARGPLTFVPAGTAALQVWVNGVQWSEVGMLYGQPPNAAVYEVRVDESGAGTVRFGDGVNGARLPTGVGNVAAQYRVGIGVSGNLGAGRVTVLRAAPLGVRAAANVVAAAGGAPGQTPAQATLSAPRQARVLQRVVSLDDFADYALGYPGITKARAEALRDHRGRAVVALTVAGGEGAPEAPGAAVLGGLEAAMVRDGARGAFRVLACEVLAFVVSARLEVSPLRPAAEVVAEAAAALAAHYAPDGRLLGEGAAASSAVAVLQGVKGVLGVELDAFHLAGATPGVKNYLEAKQARVDAHGDVVAAQLLLPAAPGGITVMAAEGP